MAKKAHKQQTSALEEVRRHVRIFIDLGRIAGESAEEEGFLDQVVVQVARAVEIDHVKVLRYRRREADLLVAAGFGWKEGIVRSATLSADLRSPPGRSFQTAQPVVIKNFQEQDDFIQRRPLLFVCFLRHGRYSQRGGGRIVPLPQSRRDPHREN